ncbi:MAG TPA: peptide MFS transporter [Sphingomicrobium sp.]|nr:peptide MFS transporter [Sphingomicrobium sp.]
MTVATSATGDAGGYEGKTFLGHPRGLYVLFFAEMWERFSFYGMRAILIFYLLQHWLFAEERAYGIYGAYAALVYISPIVGGYLADRYIGQRKAVQLGAILLTIGHGLMALEGNGGQDDPTINVFWLALSFIIMGVGFLKASISVMVGQLYAQGDPRRDPAFTIFYMGINLGAAAGSLIAGYLGMTYGWAYGFGAAGVGMLLGLIVFTIGRPALMGRGEAPDPAQLRRPVMGIPLEFMVYLGAVAGVGIVWFLIQYQAIVGWLLGGAGAVVLAYFLYEATVKLDKVSSHRIYAAIFLIALQPLFWALFEQAGSSLNVYTDRSVDREILGWEVPAAMFQSINAIYIVMLGPVFAYLWLWLARHKMEPSTPAKFGIGLVQLGLGFFVLVWGAQANPGLTPVIFIFLIYLLHTTGELCLSPVGLSAMTKLAPSRLMGLLMGAWFLSSAAGNFIGGLIAQATGGEDIAGEEAAAERVLDVYSTIGWVAVGVGIGVMLVAPFVKRLMHPEAYDGGPEQDRALAGYSEIGEPAAPGMFPGEETKPRR